MVVTCRRQLSAGINIYNCLSPSVYSILSQIKLLIPEWVFSKWTSEGRVCFRWNRESTNGSIVGKVFLNELVLSGRNDERLCKSFHVVELPRGVSKHVQSLLVIIILESNTTSIKWSINNCKTDVGIVASHLKLGLALVSRSLSFISGYNYSELERSPPPIYHTTWSHWVC